MKLTFKKIILAIIFCYVCSGIFAQNVQIFVPQFLGKHYFFVLNEGSKRDTVRSGVVGENGYVLVNLAIPEKYKGYTGMASWSVVDGGTINFIIDNTDLSITCKDSIFTRNNIFYENSEENERMKLYEAELSALNQKIDSIFKAENMTEKRDPLPFSFLAAMQSVQDKEYSAIWKKLTTDISYAAFFMRTLNYIRGLGNRIYYKPDDTKNFFADFMHYLTEEIDPSHLYNSGLWHLTITTTFSVLEEDHTLWGENMVKMLKHTNSQRVFDAFSYDLILICEQFGWADAEQVILNYLESSGRLPADPANLVNRAILQSKVKIGDKAPELDGEIPANALLIFYESGCTHCQQQLAEITKHYPEIVKKGIRVISVSTDESKEVYEYHSKSFPWPDKLCDFKGFKGENIKNYGVIGTPTIYFIDENGNIRNKQALLADIKELNLEAFTAP